MDDSAFRARVVKPQTFLRVALALLLAGAAAAHADAAAELSRARDLTDQRQYAEAITLFDQLTAAEPQNADLAIERARVLGFADRNAESAAAYAAVAGRNPQRRTDILSSWAWQTLWAGDAAGAVPLFEEHLAARPDDTQARLGLGQSLLWSGRERAAAREYATLLPTADTGLALQAARAYYWAGFPELAAPLLAGSTLPAASYLRDYRIGRELQPYLSGSLDFSNDADDLDVLAVAAVGGWRLRSSDTVELALRTTTLEGPDTSESPSRRYRVQGEQVMVSWSGRQGSLDSPRGILWPMLAVGVRDFDGWTTLAWRGRLRYAPTDSLSVLGYAGNGLLDTVGAIRNRIDYTEFNLGADYRVTPRWLIAGNLAQIAYEGGNDRSQVSARGEYLLSPARQVRVGVEGLYFTNSEPEGPGQPGLGYWNPDSYAEERVYATLAGEHGSWAWDARASAGFFQERDGYGNESSDPTFGASGTVAYDFSSRLQLRMYAGGSRSGAGIGSGGTGYYRTFAGISLTGWFELIDR